MSNKPKQGKPQQSAEDYKHVNNEIAALRAMLKENKKEPKGTIDHEKNDSQKPSKT